MEFRNLGRIDPSTPAQEFFTEYVSKRKPVIIRALLDDSSFHAQKWTDLDYLASKAGDTEVMVEPMHPTVHQFGTDVKRVSIPFRDFLTSLRKETGSYDYLTTQYGEEDDKDAETVFPPPTNALRDDFPSVPRLMGNLFLQQVNLWIGRSEEGSTSGLHHDFHDNLYCLLQGRKRFVLFPPEELKNLYSYGKLDTLHRNGLISYKDVPVREDGLSRRAACKARIKALERKIDTLRETESGKAKGKSKGKRSKEMKTLMEAHDEALDELAMIALNERHGFAWEEEVDDFDELMGDLEDDAGLGDIGADPSGDGIGDIEEDDEDEGDDEGLGKLGEDEEEEDNENEEEKVGNEPSSFSRIPTALLHKHLGLPTTAISPPDISLDDFPALLKAGTPYVVELHAGEMLYLPASWWHEVTSSSGAEDVHMAFNYWFYPPDALETFDAPYRDALVWEYLREKGDARVEKDALEGKVHAGKRCRDRGEEQASKKAKR